MTAFEAQIDKTIFIGEHVEVPSLEQTAELVLNNYELADNDPNVVYELVRIGREDLSD